MMLVPSLHLPLVRTHLDGLRREALHARLARLARQAWQACCGALATRTEVAGAAAGAAAAACCDDACCAPDACGDDADGCCDGGDRCGDARPDGTCRGRA